MTIFNLEHKGKIITQFDIGLLDRRDLDALKQLGRSDNFSFERAVKDKLPLLEEDALVTIAKEIVSDPRSCPREILASAQHRLAMASHVRL